MKTTDNFKLAVSILRAHITSLFFILLVVSVFVSFFIGEYVDGTIILAIIFVNLVLGFFQEFRASKASEKLLNLVEAKVYILRDGDLSLVRVSELVLGDIVHLVPGSIAPVDIEIIESQGAFIDDSMRTGESLPKEVKMGEQVLSGAVVSSGKLIGRVVALGEHSSISKYRSKLESVKKWNSFIVFTNNVIKYVFIIALSTIIVAMLLTVVVLGKHSLLHFFVFAIAMLVGVVPEMLPLIITIILTRESLTLSKEKVIVKRLSSLESLGSVKFLLIDKTGTITENKLKVSAVLDKGNFWEYSNSISEGEYERTGLDSAYDTALNLAIGKLPTSTHKISNFQPFSHESGYEVFTLDNGEKIARGLVGKVLPLCFESKEWPKYDSILKSAIEYENKGMRVLALAHSLAGQWEFAGFVAFYDPIKPTTAPSLEIAHSRGIGVKILTGDSKAVATNVAKELGMVRHEENVISLENKKVSELSEAELLHTVVFAKCTPEAKLELIDRYLKLGPVAFLGDGINDALALRRADVGIAVDNAADIAKESADIILLEKDLEPILRSVEVGRKALRNILTYIMYTLSGNAGTFFSLLVASFFYPVLPMLPIQILLNNLLTDLPLILIITDNPDKYAVSHVPHFEPEKILKRVFAFGMISSVFDLIYFQVYKGASVGEFQTGWFVLSILAELALILSIRSSRNLFSSPALSVPLAFAIIVSAILPFIFVYNDSLAEMFRFAELSWGSIAFIFYLVLTYMFVNEVVKYFMRKKNLYNRPVHHPHPLNSLK